jgi:hypothetical protein
VQEATYAYAVALFYLLLVLTWPLYHTDIIVYDNAIISSVCIESCVNRRQLWTKSSLTKLLKKCSIYFLMYMYAH